MDQYPHGDYCLLNNIWNMALADTGEQQLQAPANGCYAWQWTWAANDSDAPISYPSVIYGIKPWEQSRSQTTDLPRAIAALSELSARHRYRIFANGQYNLAYNLWLTRAPPRCLADDSSLIRVEIMVWMAAAGNATPHGDVIESCAAWQLYHGVREDHEQRWDCYSFRLSATDTGSAEVDLLALLHHLIDQHGMDGGLQVADVEFGTEIWHGQGQMELQEFVVQAG